MQAALGCLPLEDWTLRNEQASMLDVSARLLGCCAESLAVCGRGGGLGCAVSLRLARSVRLKMWMDAEVQKHCIDLCLLSVDADTLEPYRSHGEAATYYDRSALSWRW